jgi:hypothetical protein
MSDLAPIGDGEPVPPVTPADLSAVYSLMLRARADLPASIGMESPEQPAIGFDPGVLADACGPGANVFAIWLRCALLEMMFRHGVLALWQRGDRLDEGVFEVAAIFPISRIDRFDGEAFLQRLRDRST